ncbi:MAG: alanine--glyoxylate aminotransferase family protein [Acidobacteria bacterium]|nr:alanine--glyoxylate aminotransferase family protein [Acidobacteriota bacterium]
MSTSPPAFTLAAGPTTVSARVLAAQGSPVSYHYDPAFLERFRMLGDLVGQVYGTENDIILMQGEAVLGLEAAVVGVVRPGMKVINLANGPYGKGMGYWLAGHGAEVIEIETGFREVPAPEMIEEVAAAHPDVELLTVVHVETPCGTVSPLKQIGEICRRHDIVSLIDVVASLGGVELHPDEWGLDICISAPQKCLGGPSGMSLIAVSQAGWDLIAKNPNAPHDSFLSILDWKTKWLEGDKYPYTPSVSDVNGVIAACEQILEEGVEAAIARHAATAAACRAGVVAMGLELWPSDSRTAANSVTAVKLPEGLTDVQVRDHIRERYGVMISGALGAGNLVRIGHMGETARSLHPIIGLSALGQGLRDLGCEVDIGQGIEVAMQALSATPNL